MRYRVQIGPLARADLRAAHDYAARQAPATAAQWADRFEQALRNLQEQPQRCGIAPESKRVGRELRQLLYGRRQYKYRAIFYIKADVV